MRKKNGGFTLIEMVVVFVIASIMIVATYTSLSFLTKSNATRAAKLINSEMQQLRTITLAKEEQYALFIYKRDGKYYCEIASASKSVEHLKNSKNLGKRDLKIEYKLQGNETNYQLNGLGYIKIQYNPGNGLFTNNRSYKEIRFSAGDKENRIILANQTGRHILE